METLYCETWSDRTGVCWAWNTLSLYKGRNEHSNRTEILEKMEKYSVIPESNDTYSIGGSGKEVRSGYFIVSGNYPVSDRLIERKEMVNMKQGDAGCACEMEKVLDGFDRYYGDLQRCFKVLSSVQLEVDNRTFENVAKCACMLGNIAAFMRDEGSEKMSFEDMYESMSKLRRTK